MLVNKIDCKYYIRGAYGPGNLGDDVLMIVMINILLEAGISENDIVVTVDNLDVVKFFNLPIVFVDTDTIVHSKITILGGGGQFFSFFGEKKNTYQIFKWLLSTKGIWKKVLRKILQQSKYEYQNIAGIGLGIGPFENSVDEKYKIAQSILSKCSFLSVRDEESLNACTEMNISDVRVDTDLSFYTRGWLTEETLKKLRLCKPQKKKTIGIIIRSWPFGGNGADIVNQFTVLIEELKSKGYIIKMISLFEKRDREVIRRYEHEDWLIWNPEKMNFESFLSKLKENTALVLSARAHGVMLASIIGLPSIALPIEPKLVNISKLLPSSVSIVNSMDIGIIIDTIQNKLNDKEIYHKLRSDVEHQEETANSMVSALKGWIDANK